MSHSARRLAYIPPSNCYYSPYICFFYQNLLRGYIALVMLFKGIAILSARRVARPRSSSSCMVLHRSAVLEQAMKVTGGHLVDVANTDEEEGESDSSSERSSQPRYRREASVPGMPTSPGDESPTEEVMEKIGTDATESLRPAKAAAECTKAAAERSERWRR
jgi:hypothetical protein